MRRVLRIYRFMMRICTRARIFIRSLTRARAHTHTHTHAHTAAAYPRAAHQDDAAVRDALRSPRRHGVSQTLNHKPQTPNPKPQPHNPQPPTHAPPTGRGWGNVDEEQHHAHAGAGHVCSRRQGPVSKRQNYNPKPQVSDVRAAVWHIRCQHAGVDGGDRVVLREAARASRSEIL